MFRFSNKAIDKSMLRYRIEKKVLGRNLTYRESKSFWRVIRRLGRA